MKTAVDAAELLSLRAADLCDEAVEHLGDARIRGEASLVTGQARHAAAEAALFNGSYLFKVCGAGSVLEKYGFDRHWRNARTLSLHNPLDFKLAARGRLPAQRHPAPGGFVQLGDSCNEERAMSAVGLLFVGAVLFVNGLLFLGRIDAKSAAPFNLFVGALQVAIPFYLIATAPTPSDILLDAGIFLFGFTYLYVGISNLAGQSLVGLGWYSAWVAIMAAAFGITNIVKFHDPTIGLLWLQWSVLWALFWLVLATGRNPPHGADRLADADLVLHHLHDPRLPAAARGVGPRGHVAGAGRHRRDGGSRGAGRTVRSLRQPAEVPDPAEAEAGVPVSVS